MTEESGATTMQEPTKETAVAERNQKFFSLTPKDLTEAMAFAKMLSESSLVPKNYQGKDKIGDCLIAMHFANVLGLDVLQAMPDIAVINGRPGIFGTLGKALLRKHRFKIEEMDAEQIKKLGVARCKITRPDTGEVIERSFSMENAKIARLDKKEGPWTQYPERQLAWRAFWFAARDGAADVLRGMWGVEELRDYVDTTAVANEATLAPKELPAPMNATELVKEAIETFKSPEPTAANPVVDATPSVQAPPANGLGAEERKHLITLMAKFKVTPEQLKKHLFERYGIVDEKYPTKFVTKDKYAELCDWIENPQDELGI